MKTPKTNTLYSSFVANFISRATEVKKTKPQGASKQWWMGNRLLSNQKSEKKPKLE